MKGIIHLFFTLLEVECGSIVVKIRVVKWRDLQVEGPCVQCCFYWIVMYFWHFFFHTHSLYIHCIDFWNLIYWQYFLSIFHVKNWLTVPLTYKHNIYSAYIHILIAIYILSQVYVCIYVCMSIYKPLELKNQKYLNNF